MILAVFSSNLYKQILAVNIRGAKHFFTKAEQFRIGELTFPVTGSKLEVMDVHFITAFCIS